MARALGAWAALALCAWAVLASPAVLARSGIDEYALKAAFLYQFTKYVSWPEPAAGPVTICVLGDDPFGRALDQTLAARKSKGQLVVAKRIESPSGGRDCRIVFVSRSERPRLDGILRSLGRQATLTVADMSGFPSRGGMINLKLDADRIKLEINPGNAERVGLKIRSELLRLAEVVHD